VREIHRVIQRERERRGERREERGERRENVNKGSQHV
jgi:hypothetical protein